MSDAKRRTTEDDRCRAFGLTDGDPASAAMLSLVWDAGLTLAELVLLTWENVDFSGGILHISGRRVPLPPETRNILTSLGPGNGYLFPSRSNPLAPVTRMTANRRLRALLDAAGLTWLHPKELREQAVLRLLEHLPLEQVSQASGIEKRTLLDIWKEYGAAGVPRTTPRLGTVPPAMLEHALTADGDCLDTRIIRLSWQGGLFVREMRLLRWEDITENCRTWTIAEKRRAVPGPLEPWLRQWRTAGGDWLLQGERSGRPGDVPFLTRRAAEFFVRHGFQNASLAYLRGRGSFEDGNRERFLAFAEKRGRFQLKTAAGALGISLEEARSLTSALWGEGVLERTERDTWRLKGKQTTREQFQSVLDASVGETFTAETLRERTGLHGSLFHYYIKSAQKDGRLERTSHGRYRVPDTSNET